MVFAASELFVKQNNAQNNGVTHKVTPVPGVHKSIERTGVSLVLSFEALLARRSCLAFCPFRKSIIMKRKGCSIIFINDCNQILLFLRDDAPSIPYPGMWDIPGGHVEYGETPEQCIVREMKEEMGLDIEDFRLFSVTEFLDRIEYTFWKNANLDTDKIQLTEGQRLKWFSENDAKSTKLASGFNEIVEDFFEKAPYRCAR